MTTASYPSTIDYLFPKPSVDLNSTGGVGLSLAEIAWSGGMGDHVNPKTLRRLLIGKHPSICGGDPIILGSRISVANIIEKIDRLGYDVEKILTDYPHLSKNHMEACLEYYADNKKEIDEILEEEKEINEP